MTAILNCPFCGYDDVQFDESGAEIYLCCPNCLMLGPRAATVESAIESWNRYGKDDPGSPAEPLVILPVGLELDDVNFVMERHEVVFEPANGGGYEKTDMHSERERTYLTIIRRFMERNANA